MCSETLFVGTNSLFVIRQLTRSHESVSKLHTQARRNLWRAGGRDFGRGTQTNWGHNYTPLLPKVWIFRKRCNLSDVKVLQCNCKRARHRWVSGVYSTSMGQFAGVIAEYSGRYWWVLFKQASKQAYSIKTTWRNWKMKWDERWINSMKWSWFKVPVKVEQINEYWFSDTVQSQWKQKVAVMK